MKVTTERKTNYRLFEKRNMGLYCLLTRSGVEAVWATGGRSVLSHRGRAEEQSCQSTAYHPQYTSLFCVQIGICSMPDPALKLKIITFQHVLAMQRQLKRINSKDRPMGNSMRGSMYLLCPTDRKRNNL